MHAVKVLDWIVGVVLSIILFERPELYIIIAIEIKSRKKHRKIVLDILEIIELKVDEIEKITV